MNAANHTPGPWRASGNAKSVGVYTPDGSQVVLVPFVGAGQGRATANAALIAVAPDLLEAAEAALRYDEALRSCGNDPRKMASFCTAQGDDLDALYDDWIKKSRAAIAKFVGGAV